VSLSAFTNQVGTHSKTEVRQAFVEGFFFGNPTYRATSALNTVEVERSVKPPTTYGDKVHATDYHRTVRKVTVDQPSKWRSRLFGGENLLYDITEEKYISVEHGPFNYAPPGGDIENLVAKTHTQALNALREASAQLGADLGEARQTVSMLCDSAIKLSRSLVKLKHGDVWGALRQLGLTAKSGNRRLTRKDIANIWLEYQYGWKPLVQSLHDVEYTVLGWLKKEWVLVGINSGHVDHSDSFQNRGRTWESIVRHKARTKLIASVSGPLAANLQSLGLVNPLSIAWELLPYSFVIDWFIPVGNTLNACTATLGLTPLGGFTTTQYHYHLSAEQNYSYDGFSGCVSSGRYSEEGFDFDRDAFSTFPRPEFYYNPTPFSTPHLLNAIALVSQLH